MGKGYGTLRLFAALLLGVAVVVFSPLTPITKTQMVAEVTDLRSIYEYAKRFAPGRSLSTTTGITPMLVAEIINRRAAEGWSLSERIHTGDQEVMVLVFTRRVPWYEAPAPTPSPPAPFPVSTPPPPTAAPARPMPPRPTAAPAVPPTAAPAIPAPTMAATVSPAR